MLYSMRMDNHMTDEQIIRELRARKRRRNSRRRLIAFCIAALIMILLGSLTGRAIGRHLGTGKTVSNSEVIADMPLIKTAVDEIGNEGGEKFWSWYGFDSYVAWCACFASWCADQAGYLDAGIAPSFATVSDGIHWFQDRDQWIEAGGTPSPGDYIFFDWEQDDYRDHVGLVTGVVNGRVFTIEGNSSDRCRIKSYDLNAPVIEGYGHVDTSELSAQHEQQDQQ